MKRLIICEKPSVARAVAIGLGVPMDGGRPFSSDEWIIDAARGHLLQLAYPEAYDPSLEHWRAEDLPILPSEFRWEPREESEDLLDQILALIRSPEVDEVVNACDAGREGELIFKLIYRAAQVETPVRRAWFSSLTPGAVRRAFDSLREDTEMKGLEEAAITRDIGDWLIGINGTRAATVRASAEDPEGSPRGAVSVGRVQTPTLRILVEREREIDQYVPIPFYRVAGALAPPVSRDRAPDSLPALMVDEENEPIQFQDQAEAAVVADHLRGKAARLESHQVEEVERRAPLPFDLATLQVEASRAMGWSAARTLREAQKLYERQFISYPRTDSRFLTWDLKGQVITALNRVPDALPEVETIAQSLVAAAEDGTLSGRPFNAALVRDHHAIIPTGKSGAQELAESQARLYELIARRFVAAFMDPSLEEHHQLRVQVEDRTFGARGWRLLEVGWREVEMGREPTEPSVLEAMEAFGTRSGQGELQEAQAQERHHRRPRPHTDGSLIRAMERAGEAPPEPGPSSDEERPSQADNDGDEDQETEAGDEETGERHVGIGTPATRSGIIETLLNRRYARRHKSWIYATGRGRRLVELLDDLDLTSPELTARWEERLEGIREGTESSQTFQEELKELTRRTVEAILSRPMDELFAPPQELEACPTPDCHGQIVERDRAFGCNSWQSPEEPGCGWVVFRETSTGRIGRAEAEWRMKENRPHSRGQDQPLAAGQAAPEDMPEEMVTYNDAPPPAESLTQAFDGQDPQIVQSWEEAIQAVVEVEGPVMIRRIKEALKPGVEDLSDGKLRKSVNRATAAMIQDGVLLEVEDDRTPEGQQDKVVRLPDQPEVLLRERGPRDPLDIPHRELGAAHEALESPEGEGAFLALARAYAVPEDDFNEERKAWFRDAVEGDEGG